MKENTVTVDNSVIPSALSFAPTFNVAVAMIDRHLQEGRGAKTAIRSVDGALTYAELSEAVNRCGNVFMGLGLRAGERILMVVKDCPEFICLFFGAIKAGAIPIPVNTLLRTADYQFLLEDSSCSALVYSPELAESMEQALAAALHQPKHSFATHGGGGLRDLMDHASGDLVPAATAPEDDCFWLYSSGSTGNPKGVVHAHRDMICTSERYAVAASGLREDDTVYSVSKLFHSYGFGNAMTFPLWAGATIVLSDRRVSPEMTFEIIEAFRPTVFYGVPTLYAQQLRALETQQPDLSSLRI